MILPEAHAAVFTFIFTKRRDNKAGFMRELVVLSVPAQGEKAISSSVSWQACSAKSGPTEYAAVPAEDDSCGPE